MDDDTFQSDGCTWWPDWVYGHCCVKHDIEWHVGRTLWDKVTADVGLLQCVAETAAGPAWGFLMFLGVSVPGLLIWAKKRRKDKSKVSGYGKE